MKRIISSFTLLALSACATAPAPVTVSAKPHTAQEALRPYYASLDAKLPAARSNAQLPEQTMLTRFVFGSGVDENRSMAFWDVIAAQKPQLFLLVGDNVAGVTQDNGTADLPALTASYRRLSARQEFDRFRRSVPMMTTWDDQDFGASRAGGSFAFKEYAEKAYESYWGSSDDVKSHAGVYESRIIGPDGRRVQFILLDSRFFRSDLVLRPNRGADADGGRILPNTDGKATLLGDAQWQWLDQQLTKPADLRFIVSSVPVISSAQQGEGWSNFPKERDRLYRLLVAKGVNNAILLTGDQKAAAQYKADVHGLKRPLWEIASSTLNAAYGDRDGSANGTEPERTGGFWAGPNFAVIDIDWEGRTVKASLRRDDNGVMEEQVLRPFE